MNERQIQVPERLTDAHPLVLATKRLMESMEPERNKLIHATSERTLAIRVSRKSMSRALRLFDTVIKTWEELGGGVRTAINRFDQKPVTFFEMGPDHVHMRLEEKTEVTNKSASRYDRQYAATGLLVFTIDSYRQGLRKIWSDGKKQMLEECLGSLVDGLLAHIEEERLSRLDSECEGRQKAAAAERRGLAERAAKEETARREELNEIVEHWHRACRIRTYLDHVSELVESGQATVRDPDQHQRWRTWAYWYADVVDPTMAAGDSPLAEAPAPPVNTPVEELEFTRLTRAAITALGIADSDGLAGLTKESVRAKWSDRDWVVWNEICRVLEAMGYRQSGGGN